MFSNCTSLNTFDLSNFNTSNVTDMSYMFCYCYAITLLDLRNFDTTNCRDMSSMFKYCTAITLLDLRSFDTTNCRDMSYMFIGCRNLNKLYLSKNFFNSTTVTEYDFGDLDSWTDTESLAKFVEAITARDGAGKSVILSANTKNALTQTQKDAITAKGWTIA